MNSKWTEIISIWILVAIVTGALLWRFPGEGHLIEVSFGAILAGSTALVSVIHLFKADVDGFVRKLIYVAGGSTLILALATAYIFLSR